MEIEYFIHRRDDDKSKLNPHRGKINRLGEQFDDEVTPHMERREPLFDRVGQNYDAIIFALDSATNQIVGFATIAQRRGVGESELTSAYVEQAYRRQGIWRTMTELRESIAKTRDTTSLLILPEDNLRKTLESMGYQPVYQGDSMKKILK